MSAYISLSIFCIGQTGVVKTGICSCERREEGTRGCGDTTPHIRKLGISSKCSVSSPASMSLFT